MGNSLSLKARVLIELHPNLGIHENRVGKTHMEQDKYGIPLFRLNSWLNCM